MADVAPAAWGRSLRRLVDQGIVSADAVLAGEVRLELVTRSNQLAMVHVGDAPTVALKRHQLIPIGHDTAAVELTAYRAFGGAPIAPRLLDVGGATMAIDATCDETLHDALGRAVDVDDESALLAALGRTLAALHASTATGLDARRPWVFGVVDGELPANLHGDDSLDVFVASVARQPELHRALVATGAAWRPLAPIHGDVKFDNVLVRRDDGEPHALLIDWEFACLGLAEWDLAGVLDGMIVPAFRAGGIGGARAQLDRAGETLVAYSTASGAVDAELLVDATIARLAQSTIQFAAMREHDEAHRVFAEALLGAADDLAHAFREQRWAPAPV